MPPYILRKAFLAISDSGKGIDSRKLGPKFRSRLVSANAKPKPAATKVTAVIVAIVLNRMLISPFETWNCWNDGDDMKKLARAHHQREPFSSHPKE
jgi:hypothetical protein